MTTANQVTIARILLVPVFVVELLRYTARGEAWHRWTALTVFLLAAIGDGVDGYLARRYHQRTALGALLDPLADKLLLGLGLIILSLPRQPELNPIPLWLTGTVVARDVMLLLLLVLVRHATPHGEVRPRWTGKVATVLQMACVAWALAGFPGGLLPALALAATGFTALSGGYYLRDGLRLLRHPPAPPPSAN